MNFETLLEVARTFRGPQLAAVARAQGEELDLAGCALRSVAQQGSKASAVLTFDALVRDGMDHRPGVLFLLVTAKGYSLT